MITQWLLSILTLSLLFAPPGAGLQAKQYSAERFDVAIAVEPGGTMLVTETLVFRFVSGPFTYAFRNIPTDKTDGIEIVGATLDGVTLPWGDQSGQVEVEGRDPVEVTWHFAPTSDSAHTFGLTYRVRGVVRREPGADVLRWQALPEKHDYAISRSTTVVTYPEAVRVAEPQVTYGTAQVESAEGTATFSAQNLGADEFFILELRFAPGSLTSTAPQWQMAQEKTQTLQAGWGRWALPAIIAALLVFVVGLGAMLTYQKRFQVSAVEAPFAENRPPDDRLPALSGVLAQQGSLQYGWDYALGAFFHLAQRGVVSVEKSAGSPWYRNRTFIVRLHDVPGDLQPHEQAVIQVFFGTKKGLVREVPLHTLQNSLGQRVGHFRDALKAEVQALGGFDPLRQRARNVLIGCGVALMLLGPALAVMGLLLLTHSAIGPWPVLIAGSVFLLGLVGLIAGAAISPLSDEWARQSVGWVAFRKYLKNVTRGRESLPYAARFTEYLSYAAAFGLADIWANYLKRHEGVEIPPWFRDVSAANANHQAGFIAMLVAMNASGASSGASAAASAAAGAAGGGASGAG